MKILKALIIFSIYLSLLCIIYYVHIQYFQVNVVFYSAIFDALLAGVFVMFILKYFGSFVVFNYFEKLQLLIVSLLIGYNISISVPTVIDRSLSFYMLEKIRQQGGGIQLSKFEEVFTKEYAKDHRLVDVRLTEQQQSGTLVIKDGCVKITKRGEAFAEFSQFFRQELLPKKRLLMGEYSDDLTHPFVGNIISSNYRCD